MVVAPEILGFSENGLVDMRLTVTSAGTNRHGSARIGTDRHGSARIGKVRTMGSASGASEW